MKKLISLSSMLAIILSQAGCVGGEAPKQGQEVSFPYATPEIKQELAKKLFSKEIELGLYSQEEIAREDFLELINYESIFPHVYSSSYTQDLKIFGEKEEQQFFWYHLMRLRVLTIYRTLYGDNDDAPGYPTISHLDMLSSYSDNFINKHPKEAQEILASVIAYEEKYPYNPQKGLDEAKEKIKNMTREQAAKAFMEPLEEVNKLSDEDFKKALQNITDAQPNIPAEFQNVREKILQLFRDELEQMKKQESAKTNNTEAEPVKPQEEQNNIEPEQKDNEDTHEEYLAQRREAGIIDYTIYLQAPEMFPAELFFAEFILDQNNDDMRYAFRKLFFANNSISGHARIEGDKPLPYKVDLIWYSITENKAYSLQTDLPYEAIKTQLMPEDRKFNSLLMTFTPYGQVSLYLYDSISEKRELLRTFEAESTDLSLEDFRQSGTLYENPEQPAKDWDEYQQKALTQFPKAATFLANEGLPGKDFDFWNDIKLDVGKDYPLPERWELNKLNENGETPLIDAVRSHKDVLVTKLISAGADVNIVASSTGQTALSAAASMGHIGHVKQLIDAGANTNQPEGQSGMSPLMLAAQLGNKDIVKLLIDAGADVNAKQFINGQDIGYNALKYARESGNQEIVQLLINNGAQEPIAQQQTAGVPLTNTLDQALMAGNVEKVKEFLANGANPNTLIPGVGPALLFACTLGNAEIVQALVDAKADINSVSSTTGLTPLMMACQLGNKPIVEILVKAGADVNIQHQMNGQPSGLNALKFAQNAGFNEIADLLKQAGANE